MDCGTPGGIKLTLLYPPSRLLHARDIPLLRGFGDESAADWETCRATTRLARCTLSSCRISVDVCQTVAEPHEGHLLAVCEDQVVYVCRCPAS